MPLCRSIVVCIHESHSFPAKFSKVNNHLSQCFRTRILGALFPSIPLLLFVLATVSQKIYTSSSLAQSTLRRLTALFSQYVEMEELPEYDLTLQNEAPKWEKKILCSLSLVQCALWSAFVIWTASQDPSQDIVFLSLNVVLWVNCSYPKGLIRSLNLILQLLCSTILYLHSLQKAPILVMVFTAFSAVSATVDIADNLVNEKLNIYVFGMNILRLCIALYLTWRAGFLPLAAQRSCSYIATREDVRHAFF